MATFPLITADWEIEQIVVDPDGPPGERIEVAIRLKRLSYDDCDTLLEYAKQGWWLNISVGETRIWAP